MGPESVIGPESVTGGSVVTPTLPDTGGSFVTPTSPDTGREVPDGVTFNVSPDIAIAKLSVVPSAKFTGISVAIARFDSPCAMTDPSPSKISKFS